MLLLSMCLAQEAATQQSTGRTGDEIVRDARVVTLSDAVKLSGGKSEMVKLATVFVEQLDANEDANAATPETGDEHSRQLIAYTHAMTQDRDRNGKRPVFTLMAKDFDPKTGRIIEPTGNSFSAPTVYMQKLPSLDVVKNYSTIAELENAFGVDRGWTSAWGSGDVMNYTNSWLVFEINDAGDIETLSVFARLSRQISTGKISVRSIELSKKMFRVLQKTKAESAAENAK